jgi:hypothetical protein
MATRTVWPKLFADIHNARTTHAAYACGFILSLLCMVDGISGAGAQPAASERFFPNDVSCAPRAGYGPNPITTYCSLKDFDVSKPHFAMDALEQSLGGESVVVLRIAVWSLTDRKIVSRLCQFLTASTKEVTVSTQRDTSSEDAVEALVDCAKQKGVQKVGKQFHGLQPGGVNSYHLKVMYVETEQRWFVLVGSGNLSSGRKNIDYWMKLPDVAKTQPTPNGDLPLNPSHVSWLACIVFALNAETFDNSNAAVGAIRSQCESVLPNESGYLLPIDARRLLMRMSYLASRSSEIKVMTQGFNSKDLEFILRQAIRDGKTIKLILDDVIYWVARYEGGDYMNWKYEYDDHLLPLIRIGAQVRYLVTNHNDAIGNFQHAKLYVFKRDNGSTALVGSTNATSSAFGDNVELALEVDARTIDEWFESLWDRAIAHDAMPPQDPLR